MIDEATAAQIKEIRKHTLEAGRELTEVLDSGGLLVTADRKRQIMNEALRSFHTAMDRAQPHNLLDWYHGRQDGTPLDMYRATMQFLENYIDAVDQGKTEQTIKEVTG